MARPSSENAIDIATKAVEAVMTLLPTCDALSITMSQVAKLVGCSAPALYNHYRNKDALLRAVHDAGFAQLLGEKLTVARNTPGDALTRLRAGGIAYLHFAFDNPALYQLMFTPPRIQELASNPFQTDVGKQSFGFLRASVVACQAEGSVRHLDPDKIAFLLWSAVHGAAMLFIQGRAPLNSTRFDDYVTTSIDVLLDLITTPISTRTEQCTYSGN